MTTDTTLASCPELWHHCPAHPGATSADECHLLPETKASASVHSSRSVRILCNTWSLILQAYLIGACVFLVLLLLFLIYRKTVRDMQAALEAGTRDLQDRLKACLNRPTLYSHPLRVGITSLAFLWQEHQHRVEVNYYKDWR